MPARWFLCPDEQRTEIPQCLAGCDRRCLSVRTLRAIADERPWTGIPTTTQLLKGTREAYLEIVTDYAVNPQDALFRVHGSKAHAFLEQFTGSDELAEERIFSDLSSGKFDFYDPVEKCLYDTKTSGSYKVMRALGYHQVEVETGEVFKTGPRKGQLKTKKKWTDGGRRDLLDWAIQMNDYRMRLAEVLPNGYAVEYMRIECLVRDGGLQAASCRGVEQNGVLIEINRISDRWVSRYMAHKSRMLVEALQQGHLPSRCKTRYTWHGRKCERYCNVRENCDYGGAAAYLPYYREERKVG